MSKKVQYISAFFTFLLLVCSFIFLWKTGFFSALSSNEAMENYIDHFAPYGQVFFFVIQLLSVILAPIPSNITALAGAVLFGMWQSFILTFTAVVFGSLLVFYLARILGRNVVDRLISRKISDKSLDIIRAKQDVVLLLIFLFPFFPDDIICILAGLTTIKPLRFLIIILIARPWGLLVASAIGGTAFSLPLWGMILLGIAGLAVIIICLNRNILGYTRFI